MPVLMRVLLALPGLTLTPSLLLLRPWAVRVPLVVVLLLVTRRSSLASLVARLSRRSFVVRARVARRSSPASLVARLSCRSSLVARRSSFASLVVRVARRSLLVRYTLLLASAGGRGLVSVLLLVRWLSSRGLSSSLER